LGNQYLDDRVLRSALARALPTEMLADIEPELVELGELAGGELYDLQLADLHREPRLVRWDPWGRRVDEIELTAVWRRAAREAAERGLVAVPYERRHGALSRLHQLALVHLFTPSTDIYSCPLAMTDGAATALLASGNQALIERAVARLTSRDPETAWTSGQWMTETAGGSDVSNTGTVAHDDGGGWRLTGRKWFTSATTSEMALTLARPEGNPDGSRGLALFYVEARNPGGFVPEIRVERLKDKLGTRKLPTAELFLDGVPAIPVLDDPAAGGGVRAIAPMLNVTRLWNAMSAVALMRRGVALARDYASRRRAFGRLLEDLPLHADTLDGLDAEAEGAFHLTFRVAELLGRVEASTASDDERALLRLLTPLAKLTTARQAVAVASEVVEAFGGAGYVEDTGIPTLLRDSQVLSIWEGTTNVLSLDVLRVVGEAGAPETMGLLAAEVRRATEGVDEPGLAMASRQALGSIETAGEWLARASEESREAVETGARRFALGLGRALELALTAGHAGWCLDHSAEGGDDSRRAALRLAGLGDAVKSVRRAASP
jgi:alkylation response protein AidB-like acyl-CoA dehydrogenase